MSERLSILQEVRYGRERKRIIALCIGEQFRKCGSRESQGLSPFLEGARGAPTAAAGLQASMESRDEVSREIGGSSDVEIVRFSAAAKQFYKARGPQLHTPSYRGEPSEVDLLAWKRGIEKYFETYGVSRPREKVSLAADLLEGEAAKWWNRLWMSGRDFSITTWDELIEKLRERFLPPEGEMRVVGQWRRLQQTGSVASYADYVFRLKALCDMGASAQFKLAFFGLQPELQAEVRKYLRQNRLKQLELEKLFAVAQDAEVGLTGRVGRRGNMGQDSIPDKVGMKKQGFAAANSVLLDSGGNETVSTKSGSQASERHRDNNDRGFASSQGSTTSSWGSGNAQRTEWAREDRKSWGRSKEVADQRGGSERTTDSSGNALCFICDRTGHGWFNCPLKKGGKGCFRCGSESHQFSKCPQRRENTKTAYWGQLDLNNNNDELASSIFMMETQVISVEGAPAGSKLLYYPVSVRKYATQALLDSGASVNCIDADLADRAGGVITRRAKGVLLYPDKRQADVKGITELEVRAKGYKERITFWVVKGLGIPMLLGEPWLRSWNPTINWQTRDMTFSDGVVWRAVNEGCKQAERSKGRRWRPMGERRTIHLILGSEEDDEETNEGENEPEIPTWLSDMTDVFREPIGVLRDRRLEHSIQVREGTRPYQKAPYRLLPEQTEVLHKELKEFKDKGWIRPSRSEWATVALVVPKKDLTWRVCINYKDLKAISEMDAYLLPRIEELFTKLSRAQWFTKMDLKAGFH